MSDINTFASGGFYASRLGLIVSRTWIPFGGVAPRSLSFHYYLGTIHDDNTVTIIRDVEPAEDLAKLRERIARHNAKIGVADPELVKTHREGDRRRADAAKQGALK